MQQLACNLISKGYWHYFASTIPANKDPAAIDAKLMERYGANLDKFRRARRKAKGLANIAYLRHGRFFVLIATAGAHEIFDEHPMRDIRRRPIRHAGYSIGCGRGSDGKYHSSVKIEAEAFKALLAHFRNLAVHRLGESLVSEFRQISFMPYARIRRQLLRLLREVNEARRTAGFEPVPMLALNLRRRIVKVFADEKPLNPRVVCQAVDTSPGFRSAVAIAAEDFSSSVLTSSRRRRC
ncbi:MAG TPA: hypothetical protein VHD56_17440 [Tepidisphaeraceae bacterium]|nr:hypothetical protein [Tepidisphaeraceae bacterium]HVZ17012.1 hypothetical protein [Terriglobales bacterium]